MLGVVELNGVILFCIKMLGVLNIIKNWLCFRAGRVFFGILRGIFMILFLKKFKFCFFELIVYIDYKINGINRIIEGLIEIRNFVYKFC